MTRYEQERNKLIPTAEQYANEKAGVKKKPGQSADEFAAKWNFCFHRKMDQLWRERKSGGQR